MPHTYSIFYNCLVQILLCMFMTFFFFSRSLNEHAFPDMHVCTCKCMYVQPFVYKNMFLLNVNYCLMPCSVSEKVNTIFVKLSHTTYSTIIHAVPMPMAKFYVLFINCCETLSYCSIATSKQHSHFTYL